MKSRLSARSSFPSSPLMVRRLLALLIRFLGGLGLIGLLYQIPVQHSVHVGYNDAAYVQGFNDPLNRWGVRDEQSASITPLRWTKAQSYLVFPQIGLPAEATIRWRGLRTNNEPLPTVRVLLNGRDDLGTFQTTGGWETHVFPVEAGLLKANDVFIELRTEPVTTDDGIVRGVQVDFASLATNRWPIMPYPAQLLYGSVAVVFGTTLVRERRRQFIVALAIGLAFLLLYRVPLIGYPLRSLPPLLALVLVAVVVVRQLPRLGVWPRFLKVVLPLSVVAIWLGWLLLTAQQHVGLSIPGVERDFPVFATRATALTCPANQSGATAPCVLRADGFYQIGYPFLLWLTRSLAGLDAFAAGRFIAALSGSILLLSTWGLALRFAPFHSRHVAPVVAVAALALSPFVVQYGLYVGTDMPFAALWAAALAALFVPRRHNVWSLLGAGAVAGAAFVIRHPGVVLLPFGLLVLGFNMFATSYVSGDRGVQHRWLKNLKLTMLLWFTLGWLLITLPQLVINVRDTGAPFYSHQAKNIWLAVYGNTDYSGRWSEASNDVVLRDLIFADPNRFFDNWTRNLRAFMGTGAEDTSEFGQAIALRLLHAPANWLALLGIGVWLWRGCYLERLLIAGVALYVIGVSIGFVLPRFFLPLTPVWAVAAAVALLDIAHAVSKRWPRLSSARWQTVGALVLVGLMLDGPRIGARYVLDRQTADAVPPTQTPPP